MSKKVARELDPFPLRIAVIGAKGLGSISKCAPFVICHITGKPHSLFQTTYVRDMQDPVWNEEHDLDEFIEGEKLRFTIMDYDAGAKAEPLGTVELSSTQFLIAAKDPQSGFQDEVQLSTRGGMATLHVRIKVKVAPPSPEEIARMEEEEAEWQEEMSRRAASKTAEAAAQLAAAIGDISRQITPGNIEGDRKKWERERRLKKQEVEEKRRIKELQERVARESAVRRQEEAENAARLEAIRLASAQVDVAVHLQETGEYLTQVTLTQGDTIRELGQAICQAMTLPGRLALRIDDGMRLANDATLGEVGLRGRGRVSIEMTESVATTSEDATARIWDVETGLCELVLRGHEGSVYHAAFGPKCRFVITSSEDGTARLWSLITGRCEKILEGHKGAVFCSSLSNDTRMIATCSDDCTAKLWGLKTGMCSKTLRGHTSTVVSATYSADNESVTTVSRDLTSRIWSVSTGICQRVIMLQAQDASYGVSFSFNGSNFAVNLGGCDAEVYNVVTGKRERLLVGHEDLVTSATFSPATPQLLRAAIDNERARQAEAAKINC
jgi:hypothetical protein